MSGEGRGRVMIVDGMALLFRAYYATAYGGYIRKTSAGLPTNAVYGFCSIFSTPCQLLSPLTSFAAGIWARVRSAPKNLAATNRTVQSLRWS